MTPLNGRIRITAVGVLLRFVVAAFTVITLTLVVSVGVSAGSRGFGTPGGPALSGQLNQFFSINKVKEGENCPPKSKHHHHHATKPDEQCEDEDENGD